MSLLINLNLSGFHQIRDDRSKIQEKIKDLTGDIVNIQNEIDQLKIMLGEFNYAYERLKDFYEPKIIIKRLKYFKGDYYQARCKFQYPVSSELKVNLGKVSDYKSDKDKSLVMLAEKKMHELIRKEFPLYF
jgi:hypothetical protein